MSVPGHCPPLMPAVHAKKRKPVKKKHKAAVKRTCKTVTKKVHGKKKRVKVCKPVKKKKVVRKPASTPIGYKPTAPAFPRRTFTASSSRYSKAARTDRSCASTRSAAVEASAVA